MVVWLCNPFDNLPGEDGRIQRYTLLSEALIQAGHQAVFWSSDFRHFTKARRKVPSAYCHNGINVRLIPTMPYYRNIGLQRLWSHWRLAQDWQRLALAYVADTQQKPDVILCSSPPTSLFKAANFLAKQFGAKTLLDVQDPWPDHFYRVIPKCIRKIGTLLVKPLLMPLHQEIRYAYKCADGVSGLSDEYRVFVKREDFKEFVLCMRLPANLEIKIKEHELRLCYLGNLGSTYYLETVMKGMEQLIKDKKAVQLTVAGGGPKKGLVEKYAALYPQIRYKGFLDEGGLDTVLQNSDVGIIPMSANTYVLFAGKMIDYTGYGLAVLSGLTGGTERVLAEYSAGVMYQVDGHLSFVNEVNRMLENPSWVLQMKRNARKLAEAKFDADKIFPDFVRWIEEKSKK
jgi:glycosyltransferase involved in cell wall biosynthesis